MTGFGRGTAAADEFSITVELKTVNNRFLDVNLRLSPELQDMEPMIKRVISGRLARGRVDVNIQYERRAPVSFELNRPLISGFLSAMKEMKDEFDLDGGPDINVIARLPNVVAPKKEALGDSFISGMEKALAAALDDLQKMREEEGRMLRDEVDSLLSEIAKRLPPIQAEAAGVTAEYHDRLTKKINDLLARSETQIEIDQSRLAQEVAYIADRADISEEITRLLTHIEHFRSIMADDKDVGKRLDFLTQELNREANTITSKTNNITVKENALAIKSEIEKIREQVQNVE
jgi:uncharacterized protein (TIGR00255 family)